MSAESGPLNTTYLDHNLKAHAARSGAVTLVTQAIRFVVQFGSQVLLARMLSPEDFGLIAMIMVVTNFAVLFQSLGLSEATVQRADITQDQIDTMFWINAGVGAAVSLLILGLSPLVGLFYSEPRLVPVTMLLAAIFLIRGVAVQHGAMLRRHMRFVAVGIVEVAGMTIGVGAGIISAVAGLGYWSLAVMHLTIALVSTVGYWIAFPWRPGCPKKGSEVPELMRFGGGITGFNIVNFFSRNADNLVIGRFLGAEPLGFYSKAYGLLMLPIRQLRDPVAQVGLPVLSRLQDQPDRYRSYYLRLLLVLAFLSVPLAGFMGVHAHPLILLVLGGQWEGAVPIFSILALVALWQPLTTTSGMVVLSCGRADRYFRVGVISAIVTVASFFVGLPWGTVGVAWSYTIFGSVFVLPLLAYQYYGTPVSVGGFLGTVYRPFLATGMMVLSTRLALIPLSALGEKLSFFIVAGIAPPVYLASFFVIPGGRNVLKTVVDTVRIVIRKEPVSG